MKQSILIAVAIVGTLATAHAQRGYDNDRNQPRGGYNENPRDRNDGYNRNENYDRRGNNPVELLYQDTRRRIANGIATGRLTNRETRRVARDLQRIEYKQQQFVRDGFLDFREERELFNDLTALNRDLTWEKNDGDRYGWQDYSRHTHRQNQARPWGY